MGTYPGYKNLTEAQKQARRKAVSKAIKKKRQRAHLSREEAIQRKGGKCQVPSCGYSACNQALDFHHINPATKLFGLSIRAFFTYSKALIEAELAKCVLVCCRCHREIEAGFLEMK